MLFIHSAEKKHTKLKKNNNNKRNIKNDESAEQGL